MINPPVISKFYGIIFKRASAILIWVVSPIKKSYLLITLPEPLPKLGYSGGLFHITQMDNRSRSID
jgi:hypothetical protein